MYKHFLKRVIDIVGSLCGILLLGLPMLIIALIIKVEDPGPVLFKQKRVGKKKAGKITYYHANMILTSCKSLQHKDIKRGNVAA